MDLKSIIAKAKDFAGRNPDKVRGGIDKAEAVVNQKTGNKYADKVKQGADAVEGQLGLPKQDAGTPQAPKPSGEAPQPAGEGTPPQA